MAQAKLAVVYNNLGLFDKRDRFAKEALSRTDRLTTRERYYIEGFYYSTACGRRRPSGASTRQGP
jgi:hypothetical protein